MCNKKLSIDVTDQWEKALRWKNKCIKDPYYCTPSRALEFKDKWEEVLGFYSYVPLYKYVRVREDLYLFNEQGLGCKIYHNETTITDDEIISCPTLNEWTMIYLLISKGFHYEGIYSPKILGKVTKQYDREKCCTKFTQVIKDEKQERWY